ncbi:unnamed protein product [Alopecurus aequalis]
MNPRCAQQHAGVEEEAAASAATQLGAAESPKAPLHALIREEERCPAPPSPSAPTSFFRQMNAKEVTGYTDVVVSMEPKHGEADQTDADTSDSFDAWIHLPLDICRMIFDRLDAFSILSFPLVCRAWTDAYAENPRLRPGAPTLLTSPSNNSWEIPDDWRRGLFFINNISSREVFSVEVEGLRYRRWIGGKDEWLVTAGQDGITFQLLNPITGTCIHLPNNLQRHRSFDCVQLCRTPTLAEPDDYFAIAISANMLAYTMAGNDYWITLQNPDEYWLRYYDAIMHRGQIIAICESGNLWSWNLDKEGEYPMQLLSSCIDTRGWRKFDFILAPSINHNILIVSTYGECNHRDFSVDGVVLHEVDTDAQNIKEVRDIGDRALFLGSNYPFYVPVPVPSGDLKKNHVYIADVSDNDAISIDLLLEDIPDNISLINYSLLSNPYQVPMWFQPAFPPVLTS